MSGYCGDRLLRGHRDLVVNQSQPALITLRLPRTLHILQVWLNAVPPRRQPMAVMHESCCRFCDSRCAKAAGLDLLLLIVTRPGASF
jgi:hypothetical protein